MLFLQCQHWQNRSFLPALWRPQPVPIYNSLQNQQSLASKLKIFPGICFLQDSVPTGIFQQPNQGHGCLFLNISNLDCIYKGSEVLLEEEISACPEVLGSDLSCIIIFWGFNPEKVTSNLALAFSSTKEGNRSDDD